MVGNAALQAAQRARELIEKAVGAQLEVPASRLVFAGGRVFDAEDPDRGLSFQDAVIATEARFGTLATTGSYIPPRSPGRYRGAGVGPSPTYSYSACVVEVEVDPATGLWELRGENRCHVLRRMALVARPDLVARQIGKDSASECVQGSMPRPLRFVPKGAMVEITLRTVHGRFLLRPSRALNDVVVGVIGRAQRKYEMRIHAIAVLSNHLHLALSPDSAQHLASFMAYVGSNLAREIGALQGWRDKIWARRYRAIAVSDEEEAQVERLAYILGQGVKEGLVERPQHWPGVHCARALLSGTRLEGTWIDRTRLYESRRRGESTKPQEFAEPELTAEALAEAAELAKKAATPMDNTDFQAQWRKAVSGKYVEAALREAAGCRSSGWRRGTARASMSADRSSPPAASYRRRRGLPPETVTCEPLAVVTRLRGTFTSRRAGGPGPARILRITLSSAPAARIAAVSARRQLLRGGQRALGRGLREPLRLLAGLRRSGGLRLPRLRHLRPRFCPRELHRVPR